MIATPQRAKKYHTISCKAAQELIWSQRINGRGRIFGVAFDRVTTSKDGKRHKEEMEVLYVRFNVKKHLRTLGCGWIHPDGRVRKGWVEGARPFGAAYDRAEKGCFCIYCVGGRDRSLRGGMKGYRSIRFDSIKWIKLDGIVYKVGAPPPPQH